MKQHLPPRAIPFNELSNRTISAQRPEQRARPVQVIMLLLAAFLVLKTRLLAGGATSFPLNQLLLGLGVACGTAGFFAVGKIGGQREWWLLMWLGWIVVQCAVTMNLQVTTLDFRPTPSRPSPQHVSARLHFTLCAMH